MASAVVCGSAAKHWNKERGSAEWSVELASSKSELTSNTEKKLAGKGWEPGGGQCTQAARAAEAPPLLQLLGLTTSNFT